MFISSIFFYQLPNFALYICARIFSVLRLLQCGSDACFYALRVSLNLYDLKHVRKRLLNEMYELRKRLSRIPVSFSIKPRNK